MELWESVRMIFHKNSNSSDLPLHLLQCIHLFSGIQMIPTHLTHPISPEDLKINTRRPCVTSLTEVAVPRNKQSWAILLSNQHLGSEKFQW